MFENQTTSQPQEDALDIAARTANLRGAPAFLPLGTGVYEYERVHFGVSPKSGQERMVLALKCVEHSDPVHVGQTYQHFIPYTGTGKRTLNMVFADFARALITPFGKEAEAQIDSPAAVEAIKNAYRERLKTIVETQALLGQSYKGRRVRLEVTQGPPREKGGYLTNVRFRAI